MFKCLKAIQARYAQFERFLLRHKRLHIFLELLFLYLSVLVLLFTAALVVGMGMGLGLRFEVDCG